MEVTNDVANEVYSFRTDDRSSGVSSSFPSDCTCDSSGWVTSVKGCTLLVELGEIIEVFGFATVFTPAVDVDVDVARAAPVTVRGELPMLFVPATATAGTLLGELETTGRPDDMPPVRGDDVLDLVIAEPRNDADFCVIGGAGSLLLSLVLVLLPFTLALLSPSTGAALSATAGSAAGALVLVKVLIFCTPSGLSRCSINCASPAVVSPTALEIEAELRGLRLGWLLKLFTLGDALLRAACSRGDNNTNPRGDFTMGNASGL